MQAGRALTKLSRIANLRMNMEAVLAALEATLGDREAKVRGAAAVSLAAASSTVNRPAALAANLGGRIGRDPNSDRPHRGQIPARTRALGQIAVGSESTEAVITALIEIARSGDRSKQRYAAIVLSKFGSAVSSIPLSPSRYRASKPRRESTSRTVGPRLPGRGKK